jgi:hypothetical protein
MFHELHNETDIHIRYMSDYNTAVYTSGEGRGGEGLFTRPVGQTFLGLLNAISCILDTFYDNLKTTDSVYFM